MSHNDCVRERKKERKKRNVVVVVVVGVFTRHSPKMFNLNCCYINTSNTTTTTTSLFLFSNTFYSKYLFYLSDTTI